MWTTSHAVKVEPIGQRQPGRLSPTPENWAVTNRGIPSGFTHCCRLPLLTFFTHGQAHTPGGAAADLCPRLLVRPATFPGLSADLTNEFANADVVIVKGDLNYRRFVGDIDRDPTAPFDGGAQFSRFLSRRPIGGLSPGTTPGRGPSWRGEPVGIPRPRRYRAPDRPVPCCRARPPHRRDPPPAHRNCHSAALRRRRRRRGL